MRKPNIATCEETTIVTEVGRKGEREIEKGLRETPPSCFSCPKQASEEIIPDGSSPSQMITVTGKTPSKTLLVKPVTLRNC